MPPLHNIQGKQGVTNMQALPFNNKMIYFDGIIKWGT
jgi:hypothetical protein